MAIRSLTQFQRMYFPKKYRIEKRDSLNPEELGRYLAEKTLRHTARLLRRAIGARRKPHNT